MAFRYSWPAGIAALFFVLYQLNEWLNPTAAGAPWQLVVLVALALGIVITLTARAYRLPTWLAMLTNAAISLVAVARVAAPDTTWALLPTAGTFSVLREQLSHALDVVRSGVDPANPVPGLVVILVMLFWTMGALLAWGLSTGHPYVALFPPVIFALQLATMDRQPTPAIRSTIFVSIVAGCLLAVNLDRRQQGRMVPSGGNGSARSRISRSSMGLLASIVLGSIVLTTILSGAVPANGLLDLQGPGGPTGNSPGDLGSYNLFAGIRQRLVSSSDTPVFTAILEGDSPPEGVYFSLVTMDTYFGEQFSAGDRGLSPAANGQFQSKGHTFTGPVASISAEVEIAGLRMPWLPAPATPVGFDAVESIERSVWVRPDDGALRFEGDVTYEGMHYRVTSEIPRLDVAALAADLNGNLSPAFVRAAEADERVPEPVAVQVRQVPPGVETYLSLPDDLDPRIAELALEQTPNLSTSFERAVRLETWFRSPEFRYTTDIVPGHEATDLAAWLLDRNSPNYRAGYCENFATSLAVMARTIGIPSRVVLGFTPGTPQSDGRIIVRDRNAHAWVELWMPTQGWVRFDPTPRQDVPTPATSERADTALGFSLAPYLRVGDSVTTTTRAPEPSETRPPGDDQGPRRGEATTSPGFEMPRWVSRTLPWLSAGLLLIAGIPIVKVMRRRRRLRRLRVGDISAGWEEIVDRLDDLGAPPIAADTPAEVASKVDPAMSSLAVVYTRSVYGATAVIPDDLVTEATEALTQTENRLTATYSRYARLRATYRVAPVLRRWWQRRRTGTD